MLGLASEGAADQLDCARTFSEQGVKCHATQGQLKASAEQGRDPGGQGSRDSASAGGARERARNSALEGPAGDREGGGRKPPVFLRRAERVNAAGQGQDQREG